PLFAGLRPSQARIVVLMGELKHFLPGEAIVRTGERGDEMYVIIEGTTEVLAGDGSGRQRINQLRRGDVFGEMGLVRRAERTADAPGPGAGCRAGALARARGERGILTVGGEERAYLIDAPAAPADRPLPLVLSFHRFRGSARGQRWWTGLGRLALREGFVAVHPEGHDGVHLLGTTGRGWDFRPGETRDTDFVRALLDGLERERCVDRRRVFATGMSNGAFFASLLG